MRENSCHFDSCRHNYLDRVFESLNYSQKEHIRRYHRHVTCIIALKNTLFSFRRDPSQHNEYICECGTLFSTYYSLKIHVLGSKRNENYTQAPCPTMSEKALELARTRAVCDDDIKPINYRPIELGGHEYVENILEEPRRFDDIVDEEADDDDEIVAKETGNSDEIVNEEAGDSDEIVDDEAGNIDEIVNYQQVFDQNDRALFAAIQALEKARADIRRARVHHQK